MKISLDHVVSVFLAMAIELLRTATVEARKKEKGKAMKI